MDKVKFFKCLADKSRLRIINNLLKEPMYVELLSEKLDITPSTVSFHLKKLMDSGIVYSKKEQYYVIYHINSELFNSSLIDLLTDENEENEIENKRAEEYRKKVLESFFEYGKLKSIPVQRKKRRIVLDYMLEAFEENRDYTEREVNIIIADFHDDFCTLRREFISENLMERDKGIYKRK
ncbi:metalloregulator ArsR/SmtB family transcription factor [Oceanirhabdus seepicola]|uniref:metalloregulator ArsR/SmtB family transcription factor n=1 Tax=Oceanirhabdus seepicola TaxID=2828781 RepID=UPI00203292E2|nr:metalloregulator ArsR/SmtB family transcription factor [Oceanirhabdus seepicola]